MHKFLLSFVLFVGVCISIQHAVKLPNYIAPCSKSDPKLDQCALENGRKAIPSILPGDATYGIPSMTPLKLKKIVLDDTQVLLLQLQNLEIYGIENAELKDIKIDLNPDIIVQITLAIPEAKIKCNYSVNGQLLALPLKGNGPANFEFKGAEFTYKVKFNKIKKDDGEHLQIADSSLQTSVKGAHLHLDNLFNGDKALGDKMNMLLNENWKEIQQDIKPTIAKAIKEVIDKIFSKLLEIVPLDEVFKP